jgi:eukaryotic-like serine/threonine-protein kinase
VSSVLHIGTYQLEKRLGPEGAVETYRARPDGGAASGQPNSRPVVVKLLRADRVRRDRYQGLTQRFLAAGRRLLDLHGPGMGRVFEVGQDPLGAFVVSDFVAGVDLAGLLQAARAGGRANLDPALASLVGAKLARVLTAAHNGDKPICHQGLGPGNVVVTPDGDVVVLDFGLFASVRGLVDHGMDKWSFVAPELLGKDLEASSFLGGVAADLFALGGLLHFLLSGRQPAEAQSLAELSNRTWQELPAIPGIPDRLNHAIHALTATDPRDRCTSAELALAWLSGAQNSPQRAEPPVIQAATASAVQVAPANVPPRSASIAARPDRKSRARWPIALLAIFGLLLTATVGSLAFRMAKTASVKRAARGVAIAQHRSGETPHQPQPPQVKPRTRPPEAYLPAIPTPLPTRTTAAVPDASPDRAPGIEPIPVFPAGRFVIEQTDAGRPVRVPKHLFVDSQPHGAQVWVDGEWKGTTPLDLLVGTGGRHLVLVAPGYHMYSETFDAAEGTILRPALVPVTDPLRGSALLSVVCRTADRFPVFIDEVETGLLCPASRLPVTAGTHQIGIYLPKERKLFAVEVTVQPGPKPVEVHLGK